ncbi:MAG TPA: protein kinase [Bryobacteraceae bacterium]|nr:protein kinase [Bryobacteraceae bacterium]
MEPRESGVCPKCGTEVDSTVAGLCPACLFRGAVAGEETFTGPSSAGLVIDPLTALAGDSFGSYRPVRVLGHGGMGVVFLARQSGVLERDVALKVLKNDFDTRSIAASFAREKQTLARLHHPNIVNVFDAGVSAFLRPYFVMEIVQGLPITSHSRQYQLTVAERLSLFLQVCDAVDHAHRHGVVHRDLKPSNVLVTVEPSGREKPLARAKVIDFGIAKIMAGAQDGTPASLLTKDGKLAGTPGYMSPEQAGLIPVEAGPRSDVYSLGAMLYELLCGRPAFDLPEGTAAGSMMAILAAIRDHDPPLLSERAGDNAELRRQLKGDLETIVSKALAKDPSRRYESAGALAADLTRHLEHRPVMARPDGVLYRISKWRRRNPVAATALTVAATATVVSLLVAGLFWNRGAAGSAPLVPVSQVPFSALPGIQQNPTFSPDGRQVAFNWNGPDQQNWDIYISSGPGEPPRRLTSDPLDDVSPSWSPKGNEIAFVRSRPGHGGRLMVIDPVSGREEELLQLHSQHAWFTTSLDWSPDGKWIVVLDRPPGDPQDGLHLVNRATGERHVLTRPQKGLEDMQPMFSPRGQVAFVRDDGIGAAVYVQKLTAAMQPAGPPTQAVYSATFPAWFPNGDLLFHSFRGSSFRLWRTQLKADAPLQVLPAFGDNILQAVVSRDGRKLIASRRLGDIDLVRYTLAPNGNFQGPARFAPTTVDEFAPMVSPEGDKVAFISYRAGGYHLWTANLDGSDARRLSAEPGAELVRWSPDGQKIYFTSRDLGSSRHFSVDVRTGQLTREPDFPVYSGFSPDGKWALVDRNEKLVPGVYRVPMGAVGKPAMQKLVEGPAFHPALDPDGVWVYYTKVPSGRGELWRIRFNGSAPPEIALPEVYSPWFLPTRRRLFFTRPQGGSEPRLQTLLFQKEGRVVKVADLPSPIAGNRLLGGSPDGTTVLVPLQVKEGVELVLSELPPQ